MKQIVTTVVIVLASHLQVFSQADQVEKYVTTKMQTSHIPGMSVAVVHQGKVIFNRQYGLANVELSVPVTDTSPFKIASLTKPITAIAVMMLAEDGRLSLDSALGYYLPELPSQWSGVTVRQALSHTSGIADYFQSTDWSWRNSWRLDLTNGEFIKMAAKTTMLFKPGTSMGYSNTGFYFLGMLIEKVSSRSYQEYLDQHIFKPLEMKFTRRDTVEGIIPNRVSGYTFTNGSLKNAEYTSETWHILKGVLSQQRQTWQNWIVHFTLTNYSNIQALNRCGHPHFLIMAKKV